MDRFCVELAVFVVCGLHLETTTKRLRFYPTGSGLSNIWEGAQNIIPAVNFKFSFAPRRLYLPASRPQTLKVPAVASRLSTWDMRALGMNSEARTIVASRRLIGECGMHFAEVISLKSHPPRGQAHQSIFHSLEVCLWKDRPRNGRVDRVCQTLRLCSNSSRSGRELETSPLLSILSLPPSPLHYNYQSDPVHGDSCRRFATLDLEMFACPRNEIPRLKPIVAPRRLIGWLAACVEVTLG